MCNHIALWLCTHAHLITRSSHNCEFEPSSGHMWSEPNVQANFFFLRDLLFLPEQMIDLAQNG